MIYSTMVGRHKFCQLHIEIVIVQVIIKDIDTYILTNTGEHLTLHQMIIDLEPKNNKYDEEKLFQSVD